MWNADFIVDTFERNQEYSFLYLFTGSEGKMLRCTIKTYSMDTMVCSLDVIFRDTKKRHAKTLEAIGVTAEQLNNGMEEKNGIKLISDYFIDHDSIVLGRAIKAAVRKINENMAVHQFKMISSCQLDLVEIAEKCGVKLETDDQETLKECIKQYRKIQQIERNKFACMINYAYCMTTEYGNRPRNFIYCDTTIGRIYYDIEKDIWAMSQKEMKKTGNRIENFDIEDIKEQLRERYKVHNMSELLSVLRKRTA